MTMVGDALDRKRAVLAYQPIVESARPSHVAFFEGLVRIMDGTNRPIPARDFMGEVEDTELGRRIDCISLQLGLETLVSQSHVRLSINMSARSVGYMPWLKILNEGIQGRPDVAERLILEISEVSAMSMPEVVISFMKEMQARGISFALDNFGAGQTNFKYLRDFYFDILKVDGQFIRGLLQDADNQVFAQMLATMGHQLEMFTVAQSVEGQAEAAMLTAMGFECLQGFHFGAPTLSPPWIKAARRERRRSRERRQGTR